MKLKISKLNLYIAIIVIFAFFSCFCRPVYEAMTGAPEHKGTTGHKATAGLRQHKSTSSTIDPNKPGFAQIASKNDKLPKSTTFDQLDDQILYDRFESQTLVNEHHSNWADELNNNDHTKTGDVSPNSYKDFIKSAHKMKQFSKNNIPDGDEHLYVLKSQIVPPVCPACPSYPTLSSAEKGKKCRPCPPCGRCPEPAFECKKVPNYSSNNDSYLPLPMINDFSQFGK